MRAMSIRKSGGVIDQKPHCNGAQGKTNWRNTMSEMWGGIPSRRKSKTTSVVHRMWKTKEKELIVSEEWAEICFGNPLWRLKTRQDRRLHKRSRRQTRTKGEAVEPENKDKE